MGRLLRSLLALLARGLRSVAGRLSPADSATTVAMAADAEPFMHDEVGGPPRHWLEMVRTRAPGLHLSLQERGVTAPRPARPASTSAPLHDAPGPRRSAPPAGPREAATVSPVRHGRITPPVATPACAPMRDAQPDPQPPDGSGDATATPDDDGEWTRAPTCRSDTRTRMDDAARPLSPADAVMATAWSAGADAGAAEPAPVMPVEPPRTRAAHGGLRATPRAVGTGTARLGRATPPFAPAQDEDVALPPVRQERRDHPTPAPTPWRIEALQSPPDIDLAQLSFGSCATADRPVAGRFPALPDEAPVHPSSQRPTTVPPARAPLAPPRLRTDTSDLASAWPLMPGTRIPALRSAHAEAEHWPTLDDDGMHDGNGELPSPAGHRERLAREQRGTPWNG